MEEQNKRKIRWINAKVKASPEVSDRKLNLRIPQKMGLWLYQLLFLHWIQGMSRVWMQMSPGSELLRTYLPSDTCGFCEATF